MTNAPYKPSFEGQVAVYQSPHVTKQNLLVDVAERNKYGSLSWAAQDCDSIHVHAAIAAHLAVSEHLNNVGLIPNIHGRTLRMWAAKLAFDSEQITPKNILQVGKLAADSAIAIGSSSTSIAVTKAQLLGIHHQCKHGAEIEEMLAKAKRLKLGSVANTLLSLRGSNPENPEKKLAELVEQYPQLAHKGTFLVATPELSPAAPVYEQFPTLEEACDWIRNNQADKPEIALYRENTCLASIDPQQGTIHWHCDQAAGTYMNCTESEDVAPQTDYQISLTLSRWDDESLESGEAMETDSLVHSELQDSESVKYLLQKHSLYDVTFEEGEDRAWLIVSSHEPVENREYFEDGVHTYYSLHIEAVNDQPINRELAVAFCADMGLEANFPKPQSKSSMRMG